MVVKLFPMVVKLVSYGREIILYLNMTRYFRSYAVLNSQCSLVPFSHLDYRTVSQITPRCPFKSGSVLSYNPQLAVPRDDLPDLPPLALALISPDDLTHWGNGRWSSLLGTRVTSKKH